MASSLDFQGIPEMLGRLQRLHGPVVQAAGEALYQEGNRIMGDSVQLVPVDTGLLRSTAHVERPVQAGQSIVVALSYGGHGVAPYAAVVHFTPDPPVHHPQGQAFYLAQPMYQATAGFTDRLATGIRAGLRSP